MGCGISRLDRLVKERGMHDNYTEEDDMKEKERLRRVEKVREHTKEEKQLPHAHAAANKGGRQYYPGGRRDFDDDDRDQMLPNGGDREDSFINCPRSPSFRDYCIDDDSDEEDRHHTPFSGDDADHIKDHAANSAEYRHTNKLLQGISEDDELVKKESKGRSRGKIRGALSKGKQTKRIKSYLHVSNWHHHNNPISPSQSPQKMVAAGN
ncbi:unnamed protein product [Malus baccata var. baccata]